MSKKKIVIQCYIFDKKDFKSDKDIQKYLSYKRKPVIIEFTKTKRVIRVSKNKIKNKSLRTKKIDKGVKVVKGVLK